MSNIAICIVCDKEIPQGHAALWFDSECKIGCHASCEQSYNRITDHVQNKLKKQTERVAFDMTPELAKEVERIIECTDMKKAPEVFRKSFTLMRIIIEAERDGKRFCRTDPKNPDIIEMIILPFMVKPREKVNG